MPKLPIWPLLALLLSACVSQPQPALDVHSSDDALFLKLDTLDGGRTLATILNPWQPGELLGRYLLIDRSDSLWSEADEQTYSQQYGPLSVIRTPQQHIALTTGCHAWLLHELDALDQVSVMCDTPYVMAPAVRQWLRAGQVADGGSSSQPNAEVLLQAQSEAIWISPFEGSTTAHTLGQLPLVTIPCADYMERTPLGRASWMRLYGRLVGRAHQADSLFEVVSSRYDSLRSLSHSSQAESAPTLLAELPYGSTWYVPGGESSMARLYRDAGFDYLWADDDHYGSLALSPEAVLDKASECEVWYFKYMNPSGDWTLEEFLAQHPSFPLFRAASQGGVWGCNTSQSDFFDSTPFRPDVLLESLILRDERYFHPIR